LRHYATSRKVDGSILNEVIGFFNWLNSSSRAMALRLTQPLTEMSARNLPKSKGRPERKAHILTVIYKPIILKNLWLRHLVALWASTACYKNRFSSPSVII
jgi:hypothetical protein